MKKHIKKIVGIFLILIPVLIILISNIEGKASTKINGIDNFNISSKFVLL